MLNPSSLQLAVVRGTKIDDTKILEVGNSQVCYGLFKYFVFVGHFAKVSSIKCTDIVHASFAHPVINKLECARYAFYVSS